MTEQEAIAAQAKACAEKRIPPFAPANGVCWKCRRFIYALKAGDEGANPEKPVGSCPHCGTSYCN